VSCCWLLYGGCGWCRGGGVLVSNNCFLQQNTAASLLELYFNDSMQTVYACSGVGSQQREVADGADVVFTDTALKHDGTDGTNGTSNCYEEDVCIAIVQKRQRRDR